MRRPKRSSKDIWLEVLVVSCCSKAAAMPRRRNSCSCCSRGWVSIGSSREVAGAAHVVVCRCRGGGGGRRCRCDDQGAHGAVAVSLELECPLAGVLERAGAEVVGKAQDPEAGAQRLLRMHSPCGLLTQESRSGGPDCLGTLKEALVAELDDGTVALGPMPWLGDKPPGASCLHVPCDGLAAVIDLDRMCADPKIHALADQAVRNRVITALVLDVVVEEHLGTLPGGVLVALQRERPQRRLIKLEEATAARAGLARERTLVVALELLRVEIAETKEGALPQRRHDPALHSLDTHLDDGLVARLTHPRRQDRHAIVLGEVLVAGVEIRLVATGAAHTALEVIRDDRPRYPAEVLERAHMSCEPVGHRLGEGRLNVRVVACPERGDEHLGDLDLAAVPIHDRHRLAGVVDEGFIARHVLEAHDRVLPTQPGVVVAAERAVLTALRMLGLVLLPQQQPCYALGRQLPLDRFEVRRRIARRARGARIEPLMQLILVQIRQRPGQAGRARPAQTLLHRRARRAQHGCDLAVTQPRLALEAQHLADLAHGQPRLRHRRPPREHPEKITVARLSCSLYPARLAMERWPGLPWNTGPASRGILARHAVESAGSRICGLRTMVCDARLRNAQRAFCHKCGVTAEAHRLILQLPQRVVRSNETLGVLGYLNVSYRCAARNISRGICDSYLRGSRTKRELRWRAAQEASDVTENHQKSYCANHGDYLNDG